MHFGSFTNLMESNGSNSERVKVKVKVPFDGFDEIGGGGLSHAI